MLSQSDLKKIHILYLPKWYPNKYDPMPGLFIKRHAEAVSEYCDISVLYVHPDDQLIDQKAEIINSNKDGIRTWRIYYPKSKLKIHFLASLINLIKYFYYHFKGIRLINKEHRKPDLIHVNVLTRLGFIAWIYKLFTKTPYLITEHWTRYLPQVNSFSGNLRKVISKLVVKNSEAVLPVTGNLMRAMQSHGLLNDNYQVIPNVVDTDEFQPFEVKKNHSIKKIVHISCFTDAQKNQSGILRIIQKMSKIRQDFELRFVGNGEDFERIKTMSDQFDLTDKFVFFDGLLEGKELVETIQSSDLMILFSHYENLPVVIPESFACGIPVISTDVGGIHEHLDVSKGALVETGNEHEFLKTLMRELDQLNHYDKKKIRQYAIDTFSKEVIGKQLFNVYTNTYIP